MPADQTRVLAKSATSKAPAERFTGDVWVDVITGGAGDGTATLATVHFSPGGRSAWHMHEHGQTLHVTEGVGIVQSREGQPIIIRPGDTVETPPGVWHWHGALPDAFMSHLAYESAASGRAKKEEA
jgi:quercetin dioxygenase-like cupin family protein